MDLSLILGLVLGFGLLITSIALSGNVGTYWDVQSVMITLGGSMAAVMVNFSLKDLANVGQVLKVLLTNRESNPQEIIATIVRFAEISRREGLLVGKRAQRNMNRFSRNSAGG